MGYWNLGKPTLYNNGGERRQLSFGVHGRDTILRRVIKITSERRECHVIKVHDVHILSLKDSVPASLLTQPPAMLITPTM